MGMGMRWHSPVGSKPVAIPSRKCPVNLSSVSNIIASCPDEFLYPQYRECINTAIIPAIQTARNIF
jgi:hypothetical protein